MWIARKTLFLSFLLIFHSSLTFALSVDATDISDEKYFPAVHQELTQAKESIYVAMYEVYVNPTQPESPPYILLQDLINAHQRDLKVKVYLDRSIPFGELSHLEGLQATEELIRLITLYGYDWIRKATQLTARLAVVNPARYVWYVEGILERWSKQGYPDN